MRVRGRSSVVLSVRQGRGATTDAGPTDGHGPVGRGRGRGGVRPHAAGAGTGRGAQADTVPGPVRGGQAVRDRPAGVAPADGHDDAAPLLQPVLSAARPEDAQHATVAQLDPTDQRGRDAGTPRGRRVQPAVGRRASRGVGPGVRAVVVGVGAHGPPQLFHRVGRQEDGGVRRHGGRAVRRQHRQQHERQQRERRRGGPPRAVGRQRVASAHADGRAGRRRAHRAQTPAAVAAVAVFVFGDHHRHQFAVARRRRRHRRRRHRRPRPEEATRDVLPPSPVARVQLRRRRNDRDRSERRRRVHLAVRELRRPARRPVGRRTRTDPVRQPARRHPRLRQLLSVMIRDRRRRLRHHRRLRYGRL